VAKEALAPAPLTLRVDYFHTGSSSEEWISLDGLALEGAWPGPLDRAIDPTGLGKYRFEVRDLASQALLYSRGFDSIYGEWETTDEARTVRRTFHESVRFPLPRGRAQLLVQKRDVDRGGFRELWRHVFDPSEPLIDRAPPSAAVSVWAVQHSGPAAEKVDVLLIGDGYTSAELERWHADARRLTDELFKVEPFRSNRARFNVWALDVPAESSGISRPSTNQHRHSPARATYDAFGSERYILSFDNKRWRELAAGAPYEFVEIVANGQTYGGGGIFNQFATVVSDNAFTPYVFVHEFGHHFAGLADEYYTSAVAYNPAASRREPWEPNVTADPANPKWSDLIAPGTPCPTPWAKQEFEQQQLTIQERRRALRAANRPEAEMEGLFRQELAMTRRLLAEGKHASQVGAFEGAAYESTGLYRSQSDCVMFTRNLDGGFCVACRRAIERIIDLYAP
jgi:hypothetical protein